jgi:hypothetical protein
VARFLNIRLTRDLSGYNTRKQSISDFSAVSRAQQTKAPDTSSNTIETKQNRKGE